MQAASPNIRHVQAWHTSVDKKPEHHTRMHESCTMDVYKKKPQPFTAFIYSSISHFPYTTHYTYEYMRYTHHRKKHTLARFAFDE